MKKILILMLALIVSFSLAHQAFAAKRFGGGGSIGMQRSLPPAKNQAVQTPKSTPPTAAAAAPQAPAKRSWMGPLAGLAAGLGLAALASSLGLSEELSNVLLFALLAVLALAVLRFFMRKKASANHHGMQYAGAGAPFGTATTATSPTPTRPDFTPAWGAGATAPQAAAQPVQSFVASTIPAHFDVDSFVRKAKVHFIRMQAANDAGNLDDIRAFTSPEMFAEVALALTERQGATQTTTVLDLDAQVLEVVEDAQQTVVSVQFSGQMREEPAGTLSHFAEVWHMTKPADNSRDWIVAGVQQVS